MNGRKYLLSVGVRDYQRRGAGYVDLPTAVRDAALLYKTLVEFYGFEGMLLADRGDLASDDEELADVRGRALGPGSAEDIRRQLNELRTLVRWEDTVLLFYAGHLDKGDLLPFGYSPSVPSSRLPRLELLAELRQIPCSRLGLLFSSIFPDSHPHPAATPGRAFAVSNRFDSLALCGAANNGRYSLFAHGLRRALEQDRDGQSFTAEQWARDAAASVAGLPQPQVVGDLTALRTGKRDNGAEFEFRFQRPKLRIPSQTLQVGRVGEALCIRRESAGSEVIKWELAADEHDHGANEYLEKNEVANGWEVTACEAGEYTLFLRAESSEGERAERPVRLAIQPPPPRKLAIPTSRLDACETGTSYVQTIRVQGGYGNIQCTIEGLPEGLQYQVTQDGDGSATVTVEGVVAHPAEAGTAASHSPRPIGYDIKIRVVDANGNSVTGVRRLLTICPHDYARIEESRFKLGYHGSFERTQAIQGMLRRSIDVFTNRNDEAAKRIINGIYESLTRGITAHAQAANPGSEVSLRTFYIRKYEVTNAEWAEFMKVNKNHEPPDWHTPFRPGEATLPVSQLTYDAIQDYLRWRGTRLPTSWEWERAARGTDGRLFPWGDEFDATKCNVRESGIRQRTPVDRYKDYKSDDGVCDLVGNVKEWVDRRVYQRGATYQIYRGGCYDDTSIEALTFRDSSHAGAQFGLRENEALPGTPLPGTGFRDVVDLDLDPETPQGLVDIPGVTIEVVENGVRCSKEVAAFQMARYAVSNQEYWLFVQLENYQGALPEGWQALPRPYAQHSEMPYANEQRHLPVAGIRFRDAMAFCLWKSRYEGRIVRLPTIHQWLAAVHGGKAGLYPWGADFDPHLCNSLESGWGRRVAVHDFPEGQSPQGVSNLVGNVQEWTQDLHRSGVHLVGGGWQTRCGALRRANGSVVVAWNSISSSSGNDVGFRYVARQPGSNAR